MPANYTEILDALRELVARERIEFLPLAPDAKPVSSYAPIQKYVLDLKNGAKPESAAENLFVALCKEVLGVPPTRQVGAGEGWVDFMLPERKGDPSRSNSNRSSNATARMPCGATTPTPNTTLPRSRSTSATTNTSS